MSKKVFVTHQLPGERVHDLSRYCEVNVWVGPGLLSADNLLDETDEVFPGGAFALDTYSRPRTVSVNVDYNF